MCGRFFLVADEDSLVEEFQAIRDNPLERLPPSWNIAPTHRAMVIGQRGDTRVLRALRWGLVPPSATDLSVGARHINARAEGLFERPTFRAAARARRCLVAASGFYEWQREGARRQPFAMRPPGDGVVTFAGLWERWLAPDGGEVRSFAIVTTEANDDLRAIHARMPVAVPRAGWDAWLDPRTPQGDVRALLAPAPAGTWVPRAVGPRVGDVRNNDPTLLDDAAEAELQGVS